MIAPKREGYHDTDRQPGGLEHASHTAMSLLKAIGDRELHDVVITETRRKELKHEVDLDAARLNSLEAHYKSCHYEVKANAKRAAEEASRR
jgi:hypothetical protein